MVESIITSTAPPPIEPDEKPIRCPECGKLFATGQIRRLVIKCPRCKRWITYCDTQTGKKGSHT